MGVIRHTIAGSKFRLNVALRRLKILDERRHEPPTSQTLAGYVLAWRNIRLLHDAPFITLPA